MKGMMTVGTQYIVRRLSLCYGNGWNSTIRFLPSNPGAVTYWTAFGLIMSTCKNVYVRKKHQPDFLPWPSFRRRFQSIGGLRPYPTCHDFHDSSRDPQSIMKGFQKRPACIPQFLTALCAREMTVMVPCRVKYGHVQQVDRRRRMIKAGLRRKVDDVAC